MPTIGYGADSSSTGSSSSPVSVAVFAAVGVVAGIALVVVVVIVARRAKTRAALSSGDASSQYQWSSVYDTLGKKKTATITPEYTNPLYRGASNNPTAVPFEATEDHEPITDSF